MFLTGGKSVVQPPRMKRPTPKTAVYPKISFASGPWVIFELSDSCVCQTWPETALSPKYGDTSDVFVRPASRSLNVIRSVETTGQT